MNKLDVCVDDSSSEYVRFMRISGMRNEVERLTESVLMLGWNLRLTQDESEVERFTNTLVKPKKK